MLRCSLGSLFLTCDGEDAFFFNDKGACTDDGDAGDLISAFCGKLHAGHELLEEFADGCGMGPRCTHTHCVGGNLIVVDLSVHRPEVVKEDLCGDQCISNVILV